MSGDGCCCHDLERERIGASELEDAYAEAMGALNRVTAQRDAARDIAVRLEGELARAAEVCDAAWLWMLESGCDRRAPIMQRLRAIADADPDAVIAEGES